MSDQNDAPQEQAPETPSTDNPWGDDFDANTAWGLVTKLRGVEKDAVPKAERYEKLSGGEDPDAFRELAEKYGFQIEEDNDEPESDEWVDPTEQKLSEYEKKLERLEQAEEQRQLDAQAESFRKKVDTLSKAKDLDLKDYHVTGILQNVINRGDLSDKNIEAAFNELAEQIEEDRKAIIESYTTSKRAPKAPGSGKTASGVPNLDSNEDLTKYIQSRITDQA